MCLSVVLHKTRKLIRPPPTSLRQWENKLCGGKWVCEESWINKCVKNHELWVTLYHTTLSHFCWFMNDVMLYRSGMFFMLSVQSYIWEILRNYVKHLWQSQNNFIMSFIRWVCRVLWVLVLLCQCLETRVSTFYLYMMSVYKCERKVFFQHLFHIRNEMNVCVCVCSFGYWYSDLWKRVHACTRQASVLCSAM